MTPTAFSDAAALDHLGDGRLSATVHDRWTIGAKHNGGYLLGMLARAATMTGPHPDAIAASAHYLHSPDPGPV